MAKNHSCPLGQQRFLAETCVALKNDTADKRC